MHSRFRRTFTLFPGARVNLSKGGVSLSFGVPGASLNLSSKGARGTLAVPGTGLSASHSFASDQPLEGGVEDGVVASSAPVWSPTIERHDPQITRQFTSGPASKLTSESLEDLRRLLVSARTQLGEVESAKSAADQELAVLQREGRWRGFPLLSWMFRKRLSEIATLEVELQDHLAECEAWLAQSEATVDFDLEGHVSEAFEALVSGFEKAASCDSIWDVVGEGDVDQAKERSAAGTALKRERVRLEFASSPWLKVSERVMKFGNANGAPVFLFPAFLLVSAEGGSTPALIALGDIRCQFEISRFVEEPHDLPQDAMTAGTTWAKVNKDGSRDKRFAGNYELPIAMYGSLTLTSRTGLNEAYQFSNPVNGLWLAIALKGMQAALRDDGSFDRLMAEMTSAMESGNVLERFLDIAQRD